MSVTSDEPINWRVTQGETFLLELQYQDPDENPIDITDINVVMEIKDKPGGNVLCARLTINDGITVSDPISGIMDIVISSERTRVFNYPRAAYEILGTDQYGENILFLQGWFEVSEGLI